MLLPSASRDVAGQIPGSRDCLTRGFFAHPCDTVSRIRSSDIQPNGKHERSFERVSYTGDDLQFGSLLRGSALRQHNN